MADPVAASQVGGPTPTFSYTGCLRCWSDVGGGSYGGVVVARSAATTDARPNVRGASLGRPTRSLRSLKGYPSSVHDHLRGTVLLCRCGSRSAASRSLRGPTIMGARPGILARRSGDKPLRSFVAAGQGLAHT